jgi:transcriptional regulator with XRE-family HTH domain
MVFGIKLRELRESQNLVLRKVAAELNIDTATLSKIERSDRHARREHLPILSKIFKVSEEELKTLWLADKVCELIVNENEALNALKVAERHMSHLLTSIETI